MDTDQYAWAEHEDFIAANEWHDWTTVINEAMVRTPYDAPVIIWKRGGDEPVSIVYAGQLFKKE